MEVINDFHKPGFEFLSNFYPVKFEHPNSFEMTTSLEHSYQACKFIQKPEIATYILTLPTPGKAKTEARNLFKYEYFPTWEYHKVMIMMDLLRIKFSDEAMKELLLSTGSALLIEVNKWGDTFWGVCNGVGENNLGKLLMQVRKEILAH